MSETGEISIKFILDKNHHIHYEFNFPETKNILELELLAVHLKSMIMGVNNDDAVDGTLDALKIFTTAKGKEHLFDCIVNQLANDDDAEELQLELGEGRPLVGPDEIFQPRRNHNG